MSQEETAKRVNGAVMRIDTEFLILAKFNGLSCGNSNEILQFLQLKHFKHIQGTLRIVARLVCMSFGLLPPPGRKGYFI